MKRISMAPYPGTLVICDKKQFIARYRRAWNEDPKIETCAGVTTQHSGKKDLEYWLYAKNTAALVHELSHVALQTFELIKADPREANGEPFSYFLGHLFERASRR